MRKWTKAAGLIFMAATAVYSDRVILAGAADPVTEVTGAKPDAVKPLAADPFGTSATAPSDHAATQPADTQPGEGQSVTSSQVNVSDAGTVEIHVNEANLVEVLRMLSLQSQKNIVASNQVHGTITANLYDVTVKEALDAILHANGYDYREKGNFIFVYTNKEMQDLDKASRVQSTKVFRLFYTPAANAVNMIKPVLSTDSQVSFTTPALAGIESGGKDVGGMSHATEDMLVVTDYPDKLDQVAKILKEIDKRPQQVLIEAVILRATLQEDNNLGIDFTALGGVDFSNLSNISSSGSGSGLNQALTGQIINNAAANGVNDRGFVAGSVGGGGLRLGIVKNNIGVFISALEGITDTVVLANPKVLVLNKQMGEVHVGSQQGYRTAVTTETLTADDVKFLETGTRLAFRPYVGENGNIRMEIHPEDSSGSVNAQGLPNKFVTQVTSNVMIKDGHTIVIGGLFRESTSSTRTQVPFLGNLPGVGPLFGHRADTTVREEVIILLTPHIVKDEPAYAAASEEELKNADRLRVGIRKGMMPWGRERLAETSYEQARAEMNKSRPDRQKALWHLNCATNLNPIFSEAIDLKARVSGQELTAADGTTMRYFVRKQILAEQNRPPVASPSTEPVTIPPGERENYEGPLTRPAAQAATAPPKAAAAALAVAAAKQPPTTKPSVLSSFMSWLHQPEKDEQPVPSTVTELPLDSIDRN